MRVIRNEKGFTLMELVLVIVVLGILSAVAVVQFGGLTTSARDGAVDGGYASFQSALAIAIGECRANPSVANLADGDCAPIGTDTAGDFTTMVNARVTLSGGLASSYDPATGILKICNGVAGDGRFASATYVVGVLGALAGRTTWAAGATCAAAA